MTNEIVFDHAARRRRFDALMDQEGVDLAWFPISADLEYLTGIQRRVPTFGEVNYTHGWATGAFLARGKEPVFVLPRMVTEFDLPEGVPGEVVTVNELDDGDEVFQRVAARLGTPRTIAVGARTWGSAMLRILQAFPGAQVQDGTRLLNRLRRIKDEQELDLMRTVCRMADTALGETTPRVEAGATELDLAEEVNYHLLRNGARTWSFDTAVWSMGPLDDRDATVRISQQALRPGMGVSFDFGAVHLGYCSDFGRTIHIGEPGEEYERVYHLVMAAQQAGIDAVRPGVTAAEVHQATRKVIVEGGYGDWFRHRTGHCIGLDVHEEPYISEEDQTPLEPGMTFTIEPSIFWPGRVGVRVEDIIVCTDEGGVNLNEYSHDLVARD
ncbi:MAG: M24 family metallopeptidase [Nitriliruptoraceae bacterium]